MRDLGKSIDYLLIFVSEWTSGDWCAPISLSLSHPFLFLPHPQESSALSLSEAMFVE